MQGRKNLINEGLSDLFGKKSSITSYLAFSGIGVGLVGLASFFLLKTPDSFVYKNSGMINNLINIGTVYEISSVCSKSLDEKAPFSDLVKCNHQGMDAMADK